MYQGLLLAFLISLITSIILIYFEPYFKNFGSDKTNGIQKIHKESAIRIGSIPIIFSFFIIASTHLTSNNLNIVLLICLLPILLVGLHEDLTLKGLISTRLISIIFSSTMFVFLTGSYLENVNVVFIDYLLSFPALSILLTILGISIAGNSFNFIDGVNGLCSGLSISYLIAFYFLCIDINGIELSNIFLLLAFSVFGFWTVNIISGKIFLGDAGAYCLGILIGWSGVYISYNYNTISPWAIFFIIIYPASEFSMSFIRRLVYKKNPSTADNKHLHSLLYKLLLANFKGINSKYLSSICGLILVIYGSIPALIMFYIMHDIKLIFYSLILYIISFVILYLWCKRKLEKFELNN